MGMPLKKDAYERNILIKDRLKREGFDVVDLILLVSSDSDFIGLRNDIISQKKNLIFICFERNVAWEIRRSYHLFFEDIRDKVEFLQ